MAPVTDTALIVAHGQPSAPDGAEKALAALAAQVAERLPGWRVGSATLAAPGALAAALLTFGGRALVYPLFMTNGWFVSTRLPDRLAAAGGAGCEVLPPLGLDPALPRLMSDHAAERAAGVGLDPAATTVLIAAHGSPSDPHPKRVTEGVADALRQDGRFARIVTGYVDEAPRLGDAAVEAQDGLCLPFFAARNGHVAVDVPEALESAGYRGLLLDPLGTWPVIPEVIAAALSGAAARREAQS
ncbi:MAG: cobalamin biosynthesis protein CbiX [Rhodobacteraceae bacterium]|nr:cobalamin biosynthesis protein CbiX [Paracoccaceae bacterium]